MSHTRIALAVLAIATASRVSAGVVIEGTGGDGEEKGRQRFLMEGHKLRVDSRDGENAMIFDGATKRMIQLDAKERSYLEITQDDAAKLKAMRAQIGAAAAKKPLSRRYEKAGRSDSALGKSCDVYRVVLGEGRSEEELCVAPFGTFGVERSDFESFRAFGQYASDVSGGAVERDWADLPGVPLIAWHTSGGARRESFRATKVEKRSIAATEFSVPAGWTRKPGVAEQLEQLEQHLQKRANPQK
jgi:hypothetical protein